MDSFTPTPPLGEALTWQQVWLRALTQPSEVTYEELLNDPQASPNRAYTWVTIAAAISAITQVILSAVFQATVGFNNLIRFNFTSSSSQGFSTTQNEADPAFILAFGLVCIVPLSIVLAPIVLTIGAFILNFVAQMLGGKGDYRDLMYLMASYTSPISLFNGVLASIPIISLLSILVALYAFVLQVIAIKTVHRFGWMEAMVTAIIPVAILIGLFCCCIFAIVSLVVSAAPQ